VQRCEATGGHALYKTYTTHGTTTDSKNQSATASGSTQFQRGSNGHVLIAAQSALRRILDAERKPAHGLPVDLFSLLPVSVVSLLAGDLD